MPLVRCLATEIRKATSRLPRPILCLSLWIFVFETGLTEPKLAWNSLCEQGSQTCTSVPHPGCRVSDSVQICFLLSLDSQYTSQEVLLAAEACFSQRPQVLSDLSINAPGIPECIVLASWHFLWQTIFVICDFSKTHGPQISICPGANTHGPHWESLAQTPSREIGEVSVLNLPHISEFSSLTCFTVHQHQFARVTQLIPVLQKDPQALPLPTVSVSTTRGPSWRQSVSRIVDLELRPS